MRTPSPLLNASARVPRRPFRCVALVPVASLLLTVVGHAQESAQRRIPVVTEPASRRVFEDRLVVQGNLEAKTTAMVPARLPGTLMELFVDEGDTVTAGETALFRIDDLNLKNALEAARLDFAVAECGVREKEANLEREQANAERKKRDFERRKQLLDVNQIGTLDQLEEAESEYKQAKASVLHAESLIALAKEQTRQAATAVRIAEKNLSDATVRAPINGVVSERFQDVGEMGAPAQPVFRIVDLNTLELSAYLPARHYAAIAPGKTHVAVRVEDVDLGEQVVSYRSPTIDRQLRVFEIKCRLDNAPDTVAPGAMAEVTVVLRREEGLGVPTSSLTKREGNQVLFRLDEDTARAVPVRTGLETDGWVQVLTDAIAEGTAVVTMGQFLLNDGTPIELRTITADTPAAKEN